MKVIRPEELEKKQAQAAQRAARERAEAKRREEMKFHAFWVLQARASFDVYWNHDGFHGPVPANDNRWRA